jgi:hypothetical protein
LKALRLWSFQELVSQMAQWDYQSLLRLSFHHHGGTAMKRIIASVLLAVALLTSGVVITQYSMVGTAYADADGGY